MVVDLFAGAGGLSLGFEQAGCAVVAAVEYDPIHGLTHKFNFPDCEVLCRDVHGLQAAEVVEAARKGLRKNDPSREWQGIDIIVGGPSCQGFSSGGVRDEDDERNKLLVEFVRLVCEIKPRGFCLENVRGLMEPRFRTFRSIQFKRLRDAGYSLAGTSDWINAADYGVPQTRKRVIVLGVHDGPAPDLPAPTVTSDTYTSVTEALEGLPTIEAYAALLESDTTPLARVDVARRLATSSDYARRLAGLDVSATLAPPRIWDPSIVSGCLRTVHSAEVVARFDATSPGAEESRSRLYRLPINGIARTLRAGTGRERGAHTAPRPIHPKLPRVITVREAARLQGFPDWFRFNGRNWHGHRQIGNSVCPPMARAAAGQLMKALAARPRPLTASRPLGDVSWLYVDPSKAAELLIARRTQLPPQRGRSIRAVAITASPQVA